MSIRLVVADDQDKLGPLAAAAVLAGLPPARPVLGVATGDSPLPLYAALARATADGDVDLSDSTLIALDEYLGLGGADPRSYTAFVRSRIAGPLAVPAAGVVVPDGLATDPDAEAAALEARIADSGGVDVQIAGIGRNGHLGFNEPGTAFDSVSRVVTLSAPTREDNARFFGDDPEAVPRQAITQGLGTIFRAGSIVVIVRGAGKAAALSAALRGPVSTAVPASILQRHRAVTVVADRAAAAML